MGDTCTIKTQRERYHGVLVIPTSYVYCGDTESVSRIGIVFSYDNMLRTTGKEKLTLL